MGWFSSITNAVSKAVDQVTSEVGRAVNTVVDHPIEAAALAAGGYYAYGALGATAATGEAIATGVSTGTVTTTELGTLGGLAPVSDAVAVPVSQIAPWAPASSNAAFESALAKSGAAASSGWTAGQIASTATAGLNLASSSLKLAALGSSMNANQATSSGLTGALAASPIQTPSGLITTTPQGPITAGPVATSSGMDTQTMIVIAVAAVGIFYLVKSGNLKG